MNARNALLAAGYDAEQVDRFIGYHQTHPEIWREFEAIAFRLASSGTERWSAKAIFEVVRWQRFVSKRGAFKLCNTFTAFYARVFLAKHPQFSDFFETRRVNAC